MTTSSLSQITFVAEQAEYLKHFRADNIVKDAEFIRWHLDQMPSLGQFWKSYS